MELTCSKVRWNRDKFMDVRRRFQANKSEVVALEILEEMMSIPMEMMDESSWLDCKDLITLLLDEISVETLLVTKQILLLTALQSCPSHVVSLLALHLSKHHPTSSSLMIESASAVAVAFARRINDPNTFEQIAILLAPLTDNDLIREELEHQLDQSKDTEHRFRIYQVLLRVMELKMFNSSLLPMLYRLRDEISSEDILTKLSTLDMMSDIAISSISNANVLIITDITDKIYDLLKESKESPDGGFIFPACIKFFGSNCRFIPVFVKDYPVFMYCVLDMVHHFDLLDASLRALAFDTFAQVAYQARSKIVLQEMIGCDKLTRVMQSFGAAIGSGPVELRVRHLDALSLIFENGNDSILSTWFSDIGTPFPSLIFALVRKPFLELRIAVLRILHVLMKRNFAVQIFLELPGFSEWLLDSSTEIEWEACQEKSTLVKILIDHSSPVIDAIMLTKLKSYFNSPRNDPQVDTAL